MLRNQITSLLLLFSFIIVNAQETSTIQEDPRIAKMRGKVEWNIKENGYFSTRYIYSKSEINDLVMVAESDINWALDRKLGLSIYYLTNKHRDQALGAKWLKRQADYGNSAEAMFYWAKENSHIEKSYDTYNYMTFDALGVPENKEVCISYMKKAVKLRPSYNSHLYFTFDHYKMYREAISVLKEIVLLENDAYHAYWLSVYYREGRGTDKDLNKANTMLRKAADGNYTPAQVQYGKMLFEGKEGLTADPNRAKEYLNTACSDGDCGACDYLERKGITPKKKGSGCN
ncbi:sel1 repeat family protein [Aureitalea sp. L0-47]|uniref:tetratricopeptide repeat protein n=1 Tax=Aureitalea sp. L0-47 TaxID=2816962 RepID=UPI00223889F0|nr:hypothetical protein [Aureitalea sp. L0-47]MCW5521185.1 sel1 repeat family protein [Aureitalea sp. L0-47]